MGKQASKTSLRGGRIPQQTTPSTTLRVAGDPSTGKILAQKLRRDELLLYQGRHSQVIKTEEAIVKQLLAEGKASRARLLLQKKFFQERLLSLASEQINLPLVNKDESASPAQIPSKAGNDLLADSMKKLHLLLSLENLDLLLQESDDGGNKEVELLQKFIIANDEERQALVDKAEEELVKLQSALGAISEEHEPNEKIERLTEKAEELPEADDSPRACPDVISDQLESGQITPAEKAVAEKSGNPERSENLPETPTEEEQVEILEIRSSVTCEAPSNSNEETKPSVSSKTLVTAGGKISASLLPDVPSTAIGEEEETEIVGKPQALGELIVEETAQ